MDKERLVKLETQLSVLHELSDEFGGRTLDNVIQNLEAKVKVVKKS
jgi:hypothetical protein